MESVETHPIAFAGLLILAMPGFFLLVAAIGMFFEEWLLARSLRITCICGAKFGNAEWEEYVHEWDGYPVYKVHKAGFSRIADAKYRWHRWFKCEKRKKVADD